MNFEEFWSSTRVFQRTTVHVQHFDVFPLALGGRYQLYCSLASALKFSRVAKQNPTNLQNPKSK